jgi:hypothetical protein
MPWHHYSVRSCVHHNTHCQLLVSKLVHKHEAIKFEFPMEAAGNSVTVKGRTQIIAQNSVFVNSFLNSVVPSNRQQTFLLMFLRELLLLEQHIS